MSEETLQFAMSQEEAIALDFHQKVTERGKNVETERFSRARGCMKEEGWGSGTLHGRIEA